jgi:peptidyl-Lys metalloendopeptidase
MKRTQRLGMVVLSVVALQACAGTGDGEGVAAEEQAARRADLRVSLSLDQAAYAAHEPVRATVTIANAGRNAVKLLGWMLPAEDLEEPLFRVERDGARVAFTGPRYKRAGVNPGDFVLLASGASLTRSVDLAAFYDFSASGDHRISVEIDAGALRRDGSGGTLRSNVETAWVEARRPPPPPEPTEPGLYFTNCTATQQAQASAGFEAAIDMSGDAAAYLDGQPSATPRYTEWFGAFTTARWDRVAENFSAIAAAFVSQPVIIDCKCKKPYYAYVYPSQPYKIYVCKVFWSAPVSGTDSKGGTLIHEMSHFDAVAATDDVVYGQSACRSLADSDPDDAVRNADSHEYFAENTPFLP